MSACDFAYYEPHTIADAVGLLGTTEDPRLLAGGQILLPLLFTRRTRCRSLIDLSGVAGLDGISEEPASLALGAMCRHSTLEAWPRLCHTNPMLASTLPHLGPAAVRSRASVGGCLAFADPAAELLAIAVAQSWRLRLESRDGASEVEVEEFVTAPYRTILAPGDLLVSVRIPKTGRAGWSVEALRSSRGARPVAGVAAMVTHERERCVSARIVLFDADAAPQRLRRVESCVVGERVSEHLLDLAASEVADDAAGRTHWQRAIAGALARRALRTAIARAPLTMEPAGAQHG